ncbi:hypothetical protein GH714_022032 [Hevea brasiliensis]|uniref:Staygreen protein domain-containing protein n=1 Tax=Hevea brasiliensis TaxID=3981 RepID=A0A6A6KQP3_HEVBR|nr:hypothetical protein GH714_022032 [Hevea brasiliensis]
MEVDSLEVVQAISSAEEIWSEAVRHLVPPARFEASKLKVVLMGKEMNEYSGIIPRTYILSHCDFTANLTLTISNVINIDQLRGWYSKDDVVVEWKKIGGKLGLHIHCYVSGPNLMLDLAAELRYHIFSKEMPLVLEAVLHGDSVLLREHPELMDALVWVYFHSSSPKYNRLECWGPSRMLLSCRPFSVAFTTLPLYNSIQIFLLKAALTDMKNEMADCDIAEFKGNNDMKPKVIRLPLARGSIKRKIFSYLFQDLVNTARKIGRLFVCNSKGSS